MNVNSLLSLMCIIRFAIQITMKVKLFVCASVPYHILTSSYMELTRVVVWSGDLFMVLMETSAVAHDFKCEFLNPIIQNELTRWQPEVPDIWKHLIPWENYCQQ